MVTVKASSKSEASLSPYALFRHWEDRRAPITTSS